MSVMLQAVNPPPLLGITSRHWPCSAHVCPIHFVQERDPRGRRTPRWRGITLLHELRAAGIPTSLASDNARDQFYAYGDLDMLEVFNQVGRLHILVPLPARPARLHREQVLWAAHVRARCGMGCNTMLPASHS